MRQQAATVQPERRALQKGALRSLFRRSATPSGFTLVELMVVVAIIGTLAAAALPVMMKYVRRSKGTEPFMNLRKMFDASLMYYATDHSNTTFTILPKMFPVTVAPTPNSGGMSSHLCCLSPGGKCAPNPLYWELPTWNALHFSVDDPFYFLYEFRSQGADSLARFQAVAYGDLDCDGIYSTYERYGSVNQGVVGSSAVRIENDVE